jgi:flagellar biosynthetic protein FliP
VLATLVSVGATLLFVLGLILVVSWAANRRLNLRGAAGPRSSGSLGPELRVLRRVGIGPRQGVALLQVGDRRLLVSCGEGGVRVLARVPQEESTEESRADLDSARRARDEFKGANVVSHRGWMRRLGRAGVILFALGMGLGAPVSVSAAVEQPSTAETPGLPAMEFRLGGNGDEGGLQVTGPVGAVLLIGFLTLIPTLLLLMTSFTRILIVLHLLKQALGAQAAPPAHVITALALLLTGFVMAPTLEQVNTEALTPWMDGEMDEIEMLTTASLPFRDFMLTATRDEDLVFFLDLRGEEVSANLDEISLVTLTSAFVISELRTAFQMGFAIFLPFLVIDLVVASVLMSMGMFMLPPLMVSLPFKLLLFVLVDGWGLVVGNLVQSFR